VELDEQMKELKKAFSIKSPSEEMAKVGGYMMDKSDMSTMSASELIEGPFDGMAESEHGTMGIRDNHTIIDPLLKEFKDVTWAQQEKVLASGKYPHPIHKDNHTALEWMDHQMSEFADALVYRECLKQTIQDVANLIEQAQEWNQEDRADKSDIVNAILHDALKRLRG
jgi:hypothetical protein